MGYFQRVLLASKTKLPANSKLQYPEVTRMCESRPGHSTALQCLSYTRGAGWQGRGRASSPLLQSAPGYPSRWPISAHRTLILNTPSRQGALSFKSKGGGGGVADLPANQRPASPEWQPCKPIRPHTGPSCIFLEAVGYSREAESDSSPPTLNCQTGATLGFQSRQARRWSSFALGKIMAKGNWLLF